MMRYTLGLVLAATALTGCAQTPRERLEAGLNPVNVPVVTRADYVFDAAAPYGTLPPAEAARLDGWFRSLNLGYGDTVYIDGSADSAVRSEIARIAGSYGLLVSNGAPVTAGVVPQGNVRVIVSRTVATVPGCPNWDRKAQPNFDNRSLPNLGCAVNSNLAAMVANPEDLVQGQAGSGVFDPAVSTRAIRSYREADPTGKQGLQDISTKEDQ